MTIPFELPVKASEAAALADVIYQMAEGKPLSDELRQRLANRAALLNLETIEPHMGSLQKDPTHQSTYYLAVDGLAGGKTQPLLLHIALASAPASARTRS